MSHRPLQRILLVEDDPDIQTIVRLALGTLGGFTLEICGSGDEALSAAPFFRPDLVLLDVMMPGLDGPSTLRALRALPQTAATPVVFMTAKVQPQEVAAYRAMGALDVVGKPFDPVTLAETLNGIWTRRGTAIAP